MGQGSLRIAAASMVGVLFVQFALGIYLNLFVALPKLASPGGMMADMGAMMTFLTPVMMLHLLLGLVLIAGASLTLVLALRAGRHSAMVAALGLASTLLAAYGGLSFWLSGQHNSDSFLMAMAWLGAVSAFLSLWLGQVRTQSRQSSGP